MNIEVFSFFPQNNAQCARFILFVMRAQKCRLHFVKVTQFMCFAHNHANRISFTNTNLLKRAPFASDASPTLR